MPIRSHVFTFLMLHVKIRVLFLHRIYFVLTYLQNFNKKYNLEYKNINNFIPICEKIIQ